MTKVGFAGLGRMGRPMATRLATAGFDLAVYNRNPARAKPLEDLGVTLVGRPSELLADRELVFTMLAGPSAVEEVLTGPDGIFSTAREGAVVVEMSTIGPNAARALAEQASVAGVTLIDAPVSGSVPAAESGSLTAFVGGPECAVERARPAMEAMVGTIVRVGEGGQGAAVKLALNTVLAALNQGIAEALLLAEALGVEREPMYDALEESAVAAPYVCYKRAAFLSAEAKDEVAFDLDGLSRDVELALAHGREHDLPMFGAAAAAQVLVAARGMGLGGSDMARVVEALGRISSSS